MTGRHDYPLVGHFSDLQAVDDLLGQLERDGLVAESETRVVLRSVEGVAPAWIRTGARLGAGRPSFEACARVTRSA